jgi:ferrous iron transport protein A
MIPLDALEPGRTANLISIDGERAFRCRLMELGLLPGTRVRVVRRVDVGGLLELEVRGARLSVRQGEAGRLLVSAAGP